MPIQLTVFEGGERGGARRKGKGREGRKAGRGRGGRERSGDSSKAKEVAYFEKVTTTKEGSGCSCYFRLAIR